MVFCIVCRCFTWSIGVLSFFPNGIQTDLMKAPYCMEILILNILSFHWPKRLGCAVLDNSRCYLTTFSSGPK